MSAERYIATKRFACPICGDQTGDCRQDTDFDDRWLCSELHSGNVPGYKWLRESANDRWSIWVPDNGTTFNAERREKEEIPLLPSMPSVERDRHYRRMMEELTLHDDDRADLHRRGLTDAEIEAGGFRSVDAYQRMQWLYPVELPGIADDGRSLINSKAGYLVSAINLKGEITGFQLRKRHVEHDESRYVWLSGGKASVKLPIGENPLSVRINPNSRIVGLTEGLGVKPFMASIRLECSVIGASGGQFASSPQVLKRTLEHLQSAEIRFYPDGGAIQNHSVLKAYANTFNLLKEWGYTVKIGWWNQTEKSHGDIDEIDVGRIRYITPQQFFRQSKAIAIAKYREECRANGEKYEAPNGKPYEIWREVERMRNERHVLHYRVAIKSRMNQIGIDWTHGKIRSWLESQQRDVSELSLSHLKRLDELLKSQGFLIDAL